MVKDYEIQSLHYFSHPFSLLGNGYKALHNSRSEQPQELKTLQIDSSYLYQQKYRAY